MTTLALSAFLRAHPPLSAFTGLGWAVIAALAFAGCAGPRYVRECTKLATICGQFEDQCMAERLSCSMNKISLEACNRDNDRLMRTLTEKTK